MSRLRGMLLLLILLPAPLAGQMRPEMLEPETRVRVRSDDGAGWLVGRVAAASRDTLTLRVGSDVHSVPFTGVRRLEASRGRNRLLWSGVGALAGATAGVVYSRSTRDDDPGDIGGVRETGEGVGNTLAGALVGAAIGYFIAPERWRSVVVD